MRDDRLLTIGEAAARSALATSALRFYECQGLIAAQRTHAGQRRYRHDVLRRIGFIRVAQRVGLSLEEIGVALAELPPERAPTRSEWARLSRSWREGLEERIRLLEALRDNLTSCIGCGCLSLQACALNNPDDVAGAFGSGPQYLIGQGANASRTTARTGAIRSK